MHRECIEYGGCFNMPLLHIRVSTRSRERGQGHYGTYFLQMYIILIPEKEKKGFLYFYYFFFMQRYISYNQVYIKQWLVDCIPLLLVCTSVKHVHDRIISLRREVWYYTCMLTPPLFIEMPVSRQESERACISV